MTKALRTDFGCANKMTDGDPLWGECVDEALSPAQEVWVEQQRTLRTGSANLVRRLIEAGARVVRWDLTGPEGVELHIIEDNNGTSRLLPIAPRPTPTFLTDGRKVRMMHVRIPGPAESVLLSNNPTVKANANDTQVCYASNVLSNDLVDICDSQEYNFKSLGIEKTYPSLAIIVRPQLRCQELNRSQRAEEKRAMGNMLNLLTSNNSKLMEWLIQKRLVPSTQECDAHHPNRAGRRTFLRLARCSETSRFPHSGGYIWFCELCQPSHVVPVIRGSIFEAACDRPPSDLLRLIFHWACSTSFLTLKEVLKARAEAGVCLRDFYKLLRAVCTATLHRNASFGGENCRVEVGIVSLGTIARKSSERNIKVEVLGVMDVERKIVRLLSVEPLKDGEKNCKRRFMEILDPLAAWLDKRSKIVTDFSVDADSLRKMGFINVIQRSSDNGGVHGSNSNIMNYLKSVIPDMFQHTLSLLSRPLIQQFLDELSWRERWGWTPRVAYTNICHHIAILTQAYSGNNFVNKLKEIANNPFKEWAGDEDIEILTQKLNPTSQSLLLSSTSNVSLLKGATPSIRFRVRPRKSGPPKKSRWRNLTDMFSRKESRILESSTSSEQPSHESLQQTLSGHVAAFAAQPSPNLPLQTYESRAPSEIHSSTILPSTWTPMALPITQLTPSQPFPPALLLSSLPPPLILPSPSFSSSVLHIHATLESRALQQRCVECGRRITEDHFMVIPRCCSHCKFSTHCSTASSWHISNAHRPVIAPRRRGLRNRRSLRRTRPLIGDTRFIRDLHFLTGRCPCGFTAHEGDSLAKHLISCTYMKMSICC